MRSEIFDPLGMASRTSAAGAGATPHAREQAGVEVATASPPLLVESLTTVWDQQAEETRKRHGFG